MMNFVENKTLQAILAISLTGAAQSAGASVITASSSIDWNSFNVQIIDLSGGTNTPQLNWTSQNAFATSTSYTATPYDYQYDYQYASDFTTSLATNTPTALSQSSSIRNASILQADAQSTVGGVYNYANAQAYNQGNFELTGKGFALITADWSNSVTGGAIGDYSDYGYVYTNLSGYFNDNNGNSGSSSSNNNVYSFYSGPTNNSGTFALAVFGDGVHVVTGSLTAYSGAYTYVNAVPVPAAGWLFGTGLIGLVGFSRRKTAPV
ncbi:MAG: VPLPA-CTERM sorting domain-containing protein [Methylococcales bacterium]